MNALRARRNADGSFEPLHPPGQAGRLPSARSTDGYIPELGEALGESSECRVALGDDRDAVVLALRGILQLPLDAIERNRVFVFNLPGNALFGWTPRVHRVVVDPDNLEVDDRALFVIRTATGLLVPALVCRDAKDELHFFRSRNHPPALLGPSEAQMVGKVVLHLRSSDEADIAAVESRLTYRSDPIGGDEPRPTRNE
jgi:hypothetical protein